MLKHTIMFAVVAGLIFALVPAAQAVNYTKADYRWTGAGVGDNWATAGNWNVNLYDDDASTWTGFGAAANYPGEVAPLAEQYASDAQFPSLANPVIIDTALPFPVVSLATGLGGSSPAQGFGMGSTTVDGAIKVMTGGDINFMTDHDNSYIGGIGASVDGRETTIIMEGGRLRTDIVQVRNSYFRIEMTGGLIDNPEGAGTQFQTYHKGFVGNAHDSIMNIHGGILDAMNLPRGGATLQSTHRLIDIQNDGVLRLHPYVADPDGDHTDRILGYVLNNDITSGMIRGSNGVERLDLEALGTVQSHANSGDLRWVYDSVGLMTYAWATGAVTDVPGDTNGDQIVDIFDLDRFEEQFGGTPGVDSADFDGDGDVDIDDFATIRGNWQFGVGGAPLPAAATPEPATMSLLAIGGLMVSRIRRRQAWSKKL